MTKLKRSKKQRFPGQSEAQIAAELWSEGRFSLGPIAARRELARRARIRTEGRKHR